METIVRTRQNETTSKNLTIANAKANKLWDDAESNRFGIISMLLLVIGCMGGLAAAFGARDNSFLLALVVFPTIITLSLILGVAPMKLIIRMSIFAFLMDLVVLLF